MFPHTDFEPSNGTIEDGKAYAAWLTFLRAALNNINARVTADVDLMRTIEGQFETLAAAVDRLFDMDTYNGVSLITWDVSFSIIVNDIIPRDKVGLGLGCWVDSSNNGE